MTFTASNGITVDSETQAITGYRRIKFASENQGETFELPGAYMKALIEALDNERDKELGRWRWADEPLFVVYAHPDDHNKISVVDESSGSEFDTDRAEIAAWETDDEIQVNVARAYFDAHPDRTIPDDASYITFCDISDNGEERIAMKYGHPANKVWRIGWDTLDEADLVRDYIGDGLVTVLVRKDES